jgi:hypothetical protein
MVTLPPVNAIMMKKLKKFLPLIVFVAVLLILTGVRAWGLHLMPADGRWPDVEGGMYATPVMKNGVNYFVPPDELYDNGLGKDGIPALNSPTYVSVASADEVLADEVEGIDVEVNGKHRFYSFQILNWHQLVNDRFGDKDLLVSYSTLCGSAVVYDRKDENGVVRTFGDNGQVYNNCAVLYDNTTSELWDQASGVLIAGRDTSASLTRYPSSVMRWDVWKKAYPYGEALSTETGFTRDYRRHPYGNYDKNASLYFPVNKTDTRLPVKDPVYDFVLGGSHVGVTLKFVSLAAEPNYSVGGKSLAAFIDDENMVHLFDRTVDGQTLTFVRENNEIKDKETDSRWSEEGIALKGELKGKRLVELTPTARYFAFAYVSHFPTATLLGGDEFDTLQQPATAPEGTDLNVNQ